MLDFFFTDKFDNEIILKNKEKSISKKELKRYVCNNIPLLEQKKKDVVIFADDIMTFCVNFFASVLSGKNIYLVDDICRIKSFEKDVDIIDSCDLSENNSVCEFREVNPDNVIINLLTSGSSGGGTCIQKSLTNLINEAKDTYETFHIKEQLIVTSSTTCGHLFGLTFGFMFPLCNNYPIYLDNIEYPDLYDVENSFFVSTPAFLDIVKKNNIRLNSKYIISAGSKLKNDTFEYLENFSNIIEIYGSTETGVIAYRRHYNNCLTLFGNVKLKSLEDSTIIESPYSFEGTVEINDRVELNGNKIILKNRTDRLLKIQEKRISAESLENYLNCSDLINECYCFKNQDKIACLCVLSGYGIKYLKEYNVPELIKHIKKYLHKDFEIVPQRFRFIDELPRTKTGKIDKSFIEHLFEINTSLPIILNREICENSISLSIYFYKNCDFYSGHFPNFPITPGVVQLYFASFWGEYFFHDKLADGQIKRIKFSNIIEAGEIIKLKLEKKGSSVMFEYSNDKKVFSSGVFSCENIFKGVV